MTHSDNHIGYRYGIIREEYVLGTGSRISYGVAAYAHPEETGCATVAVAVRDITVDRTAAEAFASLCNRLSLSPTQLREASEDYFDL